MSSRLAPIKPVVHIAVASAGVSLLVLIAPHINPWTMTAVRAAMVEGIARVELSGREVQFSRASWTAAVSLLALGTLLAARRRLRATGAIQARVSIALACTAALLFTLTPAERGFGVVLELVLGSAGFALLVAGAAPLLGPTLARLGVPMRRLARSFRELPPQLFAALVFSFVFVVANLGSWLLFGHIPHVIDSMVQLFHAKMLLLGKVWVPSPVPSEFFDITHMINDGRWYSQYPPGHTALLALGHVVHAPWAVGPLFGGLSAALLYFIGREMYDDLTGRVAAVLACLSPFLLLMSSSFMNHASTLFFLELFLLGFVRMVQGAGPGAAALAGLALGYAFAIRPMTAAAVGAPFALYAVWQLATAGAVFFRRALVALAAFAIPVAALLAFNQLTNGDPFRFGYEALYGKDVFPGFGRSGWQSEPHDAARGLTSTLKNFNALNQYLLALPVPALALALLGMTWRRLQIWDGLLIASVACLAGAYSLFWYQDWALGPRFFYCATAPLLLSSAAGVLALPAFLSRLAGPGARFDMKSHVLLALLIAFGYGLTTRVPVLASYYSRNFANGNRKVVRDVGEGPPGQSVVLVPYTIFPSLFPKNDPLLESRVIYARDLGFEKNERLRSRFPDRRFFKLFSFEDYAIVPYDQERLARDRAYPVPVRGPITIEALTFQTSRIRGGTAENEKMGELGGQWKNHDQLRVISRDAGAEVGFRLWAEAASERTLAAMFTHGPDLGVIEVRLNGESLVETIDLYSPRHHARKTSLGRARLRAGLNTLVLRVVAKNERSASYGMALDYLVID